MANAVATPSCFLSRLGRFDLAMWHVQLPTGDVVHPMVLCPVGQYTVQGVREPGPAGADQQIQFARVWLGVTKTFIRRARRQDAARICPLCTADAEQRGIPNLSDYP